jgi:uncharacterized protein YqjF (DUF2071 family)
MSASPPPVFLTAEWRSLVMLNYAVDPAVLAPYVPRGVKLDLWEGEALVSMVGFLFLQTRVLGVPIPFHRNFDEVNLRFYVRRPESAGGQRGVVFISEIVPRLAISLVARGLYNEPYRAMPMRHRIADGDYAYSWKFGGHWQTLGASVRGEAQPITPGSAPEFIFEHYWGYTRQRDGGTVEYQVEHPRWRVWTAECSHLEVDVAALYGPQFVPALSAPPRSAFVAEGSPVLVRRGVRVKECVP